MLYFRLLILVFVNFCVVYFVTIFDGLFRAVVTIPWGDGDIANLENARPQLVDSLKNVMDVYREANRDCETCEGFIPLCNRASMRLFNEKLIPDFEGWGCRMEAYEN